MAFRLEDIEMGHLPIMVSTVTPRFHLEPSPRRVRSSFGDTTIADSTRALLLREVGRLPVYYFPVGDIRMEALERTSHMTTSDLKGTATYWTVRVGERVAENAAWSYEVSPVGGPDLREHVAFYWNEMDAWYEEDERAFGHARDPYKLGVDVRRSTRSVRVEIGGVTVAETRHPWLLFESDLPIRYYIPTEDVRVELLEPSATKTQCAYKGEASHWNARIGQRVIPDVAWSYPEPLTPAAPIAGAICFYQERIDALFVDEEQMERPRTPWSS